MVSAGMRIRGRYLPRYRTSILRPNSHMMGSVELAESLSSGLNLKLSGAGLIHMHTAQLMQTEVVDAAKWIRLVVRGGGLRRLSFGF